MADLPVPADRRCRNNTLAKPSGWQGWVWLLAGCVCLSLAASAQEAEPIAPPAPATAPVSPPSVPSAAPAPRAAAVPATAATPPADSSDGPPAVAKPADTAAAVDSVEGLASYYARKFAGRRTASGEVFDPQALTMAHRSWPFGTAVRVTHLLSGRSVVVRVNDRGPHVRRRVADLSPAAARALGMLHEGITRVRLDVLPSPTAGR